MTFVELLLIAIGVSMDAFAVSICKGISVGTLRPVYPFKAAIWFGGFQALMPLAGYFLGVGFADMVSAVDHWIAFALLCLIGANMIKDASTDGNPSPNPDFSFRTMLPGAVATSIDAFAIGVSLALFKIDIWYAIAVIGITTALFSAAGVYIGSRFGGRFRSKATLVGGIILCFIGIKILIEHTLLS